MFPQQLRVLRRLIQLRGQEATVCKNTLNEFGEVSGTENIGTTRGLFHEANGYLGTLIAEAGKTYAEKQPMFLVEYTGSIQKEDVLEIRGTRFRVTGMDDLGNLGIFLDISLEVL